MSFFDLPDNPKFLEGGLHEQEDVAVYTWGEDSYDGLGGALLEGGDDFNDETFGGSGPIGKDFDFVGQPTDVLSGHRSVSGAGPTQQSQAANPSIHASTHDHQSNVSSLWDSKSIFSVLPKPATQSRITDNSKVAHSVAGARAAPTHAPRTLQEIEEEMIKKAAAQQQSKQEDQQRQLQQKSSFSTLGQSEGRAAPSLKQALTMEEVERQMRGHRITPDLSTSHHATHPQFLAHPHHEKKLSTSSMDQIHMLQALQSQQQAMQVMPDQGYHQTLHDRIPSNIGMISPSELMHAQQRQQQMLSMPPEQQELLRMRAAQQIMEQEILEAKRRRKLLKISRMSRNNDLMTQSDKDFITRIQISQLMMSDPYEEDFYNQVFQTLARKRIGVQVADPTTGRAAKPEAGGRVGKSGRRQNAMQRMESQVERIINNVRLREKEKDLHSIHHLQGALGKTSGRSYKAAPRQLLQVDASGNVPQQPHEVASNDARATDATTKTNIPLAATGTIPMERAPRNRPETSAPIPGSTLPRLQSLTTKQTLVLLEKAYTLLLQAEHMRREQPSPEDEAAGKEWAHRREERIDEILATMQVHVAQDASVPHPLISLLHPFKGKKIIPRVLRQLEKSQQLDLLFAIVNNFSQLDVVANAAVLDELDESDWRSEIERQTHAFMNNVFNGFLPLLMELSLAPLNHLLAALITRTDISRVLKSQAGVALFTAVLTQVANLKHVVYENETAGIASVEDFERWQQLFDRSFQIIAPHLIALFPSTRLSLNLPFGAEHYQKPSPLTDALDQPVWNFFATFAVHATVEQQQILVTVLREKVLELVYSANKVWNTEEGNRRTANVNLFLNALGLDSSQIAM